MEPTLALQQTWRVYMYIIMDKQKGRLVLISGCWGFLDNVRGYAEEVTHFLSILASNISGTNPNKYWPTEEESFNKKSGNSQVWDDPPQIVRGKYEPDGVIWSSVKITVTSKRW